MEDIFKDKVYEEMDWLSQATEPMIDPRNELLALLPDEIEITLDHIKEAIKGCRHNHFEINKDSILQAVLTTEKEFTSDVKREVNRCFETKASDNCSLTIDEDGFNLDGEIKIIKAKNIFNDEESARYMADVASNICRIKKDYLDKGRLNEISGLFNAEGIGKLRSTNRKFQQLKKEMYLVLSQNQWNIKDVNLGIKVGRWVRDFIRDGDMSAIANLWKMKAMTHSGLPIYSISEA